MLERLTEIPTSPPLALLLITAVGAVSILMIASALIPILLEMSLPSFRTPNILIVALFFILALSASVTFAGDRRSPIPELTALESCNNGISNKPSNYIIFSPCAYSDSKPQCPSSMPAGLGGALCTEQANYYFNVVQSNPPPGNPVTFSATYYYCPDETPKWNGSACVKRGPCDDKGGLSVDDGSLDFGDGSNTKLSMSFNVRSDDNYVGQTFCSAGCLAAVDKETGGAGGVFEGKYYGQFSAKYSGQSCQSGQPEATPKTTPALIPKTTPEYDCLAKGMAYGYVNDVVKCVAKTSTKETEKKSSETTKPDGSKTKETRTDNTVCANGVCTTTTTIVTTEYNSSGTETGTSTKTETTSKPDPNSGLGTGGVGKGEGQGMDCGGPGKPPCAVEVYETGTPSDLSGISANKSAFESAMDQWASKFSEVASPKQWGVVWNYQLPQGACTPLQFGGTRFHTSMDICKPLGYVRDLWNYVMVVLTGLYIWRSCRDALNLT